MSQSNTQQGQIVLPANINLKGKEGLLCQIIKSASTGKASFTIHNNEALVNPNFVITDGDEQDKSTAALPLSPDRSVRVILAGACEAGDTLVAASVGGGTAGRVRKLPATAGTYVIIGIAEEDGVNTQLVKLRPHRTGERITVS